MAVINQYRHQELSELPSWSEQESTIDRLSPLSYFSFAATQPLMGTVQGHHSGEKPNRKPEKLWACPCMGALWVLPVSPVSGCEMSRQSEVDCHHEENSCKSHLNCVTQEEKSVPTISLTLLIWKSPIPSPLTLSSYVTAFT